MFVLSRYKKLYYIDKALSVQNLISFEHKTNVSENSRLILNFSQEAIISDVVVKIFYFYGVGQRTLRPAKRTEQPGEMEQRTQQIM